MGSVELVESTCKARQPFAANVTNLLLTLFGNLRFRILPYASTGVETRAVAVLDPQIEIELSLLISAALYQPKPAEKLLCACCDHCSMTNGKRLSCSHTHFP